MTANARRAVVIGLLLWSAAVFAPALSGGFVWDDHLLIGNNSLLRDSDGAMQALTGGFWDVSSEVGATGRYYRPVVTLAYYLQYQLFGLAPMGYHLVNLGLHLGCVALAFVWLRRRLLPPASSVADELAFPASFGAALGGLLFAVHPTRVESVSWISGCTDLWMALFVLLALCLLSSGLPQTRARRAAVLALFVLALLSKEAAIVVPLLLASDALVLSQQPSERTARLRFAALLLGVMLLVVALRLLLVPLPSVGMRDLLWALPQRVTSSFGHYLHAILWPASPTVLRGQLAMDAQGRLIFEPLSLLLGAFGAAVLSGMLLWSRRAPAVRPYLADALWLVVGLLPVLNLIPLGLPALVADRFVYLPLLGVCALLARLTFAAVRGGSRRALLPLSVGGLAIALALSAATIAHGRDFRDDFTLWRNELALDPERPYVLERMAVFVLAQGDYERALIFARRGYELAAERRQRGLEVRFAGLALRVLSRSTPDLEQARLRSLRDAYDSLLRTGQAELALAPVGAGDRVLSPGMRLSLSLDPRQRELLVAEISDFRLPHAELYARTQELERARVMLAELAQRHPRAADVQAKYALVLARLRRFEQARQALQQARAAAAAAPAVVAAERAITRASAPPPGQDPIELAVSEARIDLLLGAPGQARKRLEPLLAANRQHVALIAVRAQIDAIDRRPDLAQARIAAARRALPEMTPRWDALEAEIARFASR